MLAFAFLLSIAPPEAAMFALPFCGGVELPAWVDADRAGPVAVPVRGCATAVRVVCDASVVAQPARSFLVTGDALPVELTPAGVPGLAACTVHTAQGSSVLRVRIP